MAPSKRLEALQIRVLEAQERALKNEERRSEAIRQDAREHNARIAENKRHFDQIPDEHEPHCKW